MLGDGDRLLGRDPVCDFQPSAKRVVLMNSGADQQLGEAFAAWASTKMGAIEARIRAERDYVSALEGARRLSLNKRQFTALMKKWKIEPVYLSQLRRRWRWDKIEAALQKRELPSLKIAA